MDWLVRAGETADRQKDTVLICVLSVRRALRTKQAAYPPMKHGLDELETLLLVNSGLRECFGIPTDLDLLGGHDPERMATGEGRRPQKRCEETDGKGKELVKTDGSGETGCVKRKRIGQGKR